MYILEVIYNPVNHIIPPKIGMANLLLYDKFVICQEENHQVSLWEKI